MRAPHVVLAANIHLGELMPQLAATLLPITTYVMVTEPIPGLNDVIRYRGGISDTDRADNHYRIVDGNRLQWAGRMRVWTAAALHRALARRRHQAQFPAAWRGRGRASVARHARPRDPPDAADRRHRAGFWVASGFGGHGLNTTAMAGELIARGIVENDETWRLFAPYELVWAGGTLGRAVAQGL